MASCDNCGTTILFGGQKVGAHRFCNDSCAANGAFMRVAEQLPADLVEQQAWNLRQAPCPVCQGPGPVDVHTSHRVYSVLVMTSWRNQPRLSCRSCGTKAKLTDTAVSFFAGWWGFPWGLIMTPVQIGRNIVGMVSARDGSAPSPQLQKTVRTMIASQLAERPAKDP